MVSIVMELSTGVRVVPLTGPGIVKLTFVLTTAANPIPTSEVIVPNTGRIPKPVAPVGPVIPIPVGPVAPVRPVIPIPVGPVAPVGPVIPIPVGPVAPVGPVIPIPAKPVAPVGPVIPVGPVGNVNGGMDGRVGPIKFGSRESPCKIISSSLI
ncbi:Collagen triple helix repeat protein [Bacillus cereus Rock3-28]|nr:Collagen triple helix repeat protein [Bacillus cereus Rock3-28]